MGEDQIVPAVISDQPVGGGEVDADRPFLVADLSFEARNIDVGDRRRAGHSPVHILGAVHGLSFWRSGWAAANASIFFAFSSAHSKVGNASSGTSNRRAL